MLGIVQLERSHICKDSDEPQLVLDDTRTTTCICQRLLLHLQYIPCRLIYLRQVDERFVSEQHQKMAGVKY